MAIWRKPEPTDADLVARCVRSGDRQAFSELVFRYQDAMLRLATRYSGNPEDAEDLAQDIFVRVWTRLKTFDQKRDFRPWLYQVGTSVCLNWIEARKSRGGFGSSSTSIPLDQLGEMRGGASTDDIALEKIETDVVLEALERMPLPNRTAITLRFMEGFTFQEIASILEVPLPTVASRVRRGLETLRAELAARGVDR